MFKKILISLESQESIYGLQFQSQTKHEVPKAFKETYLPYV
jgi:hypothetical protein